MINKFSEDRSASQLFQKKDGRRDKVACRGLLAPIIT